MTSLKTLIIGLALGAVLGGTSAYVYFFNQPIDVVYVSPDTPVVDMDEPARATIPSRSYGIPHRPAGRSGAALPGSSPTTATATEAGMMPRIDSQASCLVSGLLVEPDGTASQRRNLRWTATFGPQTLRGYTTTDEFGRFEIALQGGLHAGVAGQLRLVPGKPHLGLQMDSPAKQVAEASLPLRLARGEHFLGDVQWRLLPLIAQGVIKNEEGAPVPRADIDFTVYDSSTKTNRVMRVKTDNQGRFELRYETTAGRVTFEVKKFNFVPVTIEGDTGRDDWEITFHKAALLYGMLVNADDNIKVILVSSDGRKHENAELRRGKSATSFRFHDIMPGWATLTILDGSRVIGEKSVNLLKGSNRIRETFDAAP